MVKKNDAIFITKDKDNNINVNMPITRLANIESDADIKDNSTDEDYVPIIDTADNEQFKKIKARDLNTPAFTEATNLTKLTSKERFTVAFGKIAKAISDLIAHLGDMVKHVTDEERAAWNGKAAGSHTHGAASSTANGFMSADDKTKLDGISTGANKYTHPTSAGNKHIPSGGASGQILRWSSDGTAEWGADNNTTYTPASASPKAPGIAAVGTSEKYAREDHVHPLQASNLPDISVQNRVTYGAISSAETYNGYYKILSCKLTGTHDGSVGHVRIYNPNEYNHNTGFMDLFINFGQGTAYNTCEIYGYANSVGTGFLGHLYVKKPTTPGGEIAIYWLRNYTYGVLTIVPVEFSDKGGTYKKTRWDWDFPNTPAESIEESGYTITGIEEARNGAKNYVYVYTLTQLAATQTANGLMSTADKKKLDSLTELVTISGDVTVTEIHYGTEVIRLKVVIDKTTVLNAGMSLIVKNLSVSTSGDILASITGYIGNCLFYYQSTEQGIECSVTNSTNGKVTITSGTYYI